VRRCRAPHEQDEPFGNVYIEALATGLPIVAHAWEGTRWILEDTSLLIDTDSIGAVQAGLRDAITATAPALVAARRELASQRFSWAAIGEQYADFIRGVVERAA
jgi:glycosyltransferase involved in cell wall biosynthesis